MKVIDHLYRRNLFTVGSTGLFYVASAAGTKKQHLWFKRFSDGKVIQLHTFDRDLYWGLDLSPGEREILFSQYDVNTTEIMLVESFR